MKFFGHSIHIMLIHFPSALFPVHVLFAILGKYTFSVSLVEAGFYINVVGCIMGWIALLFGLLDLMQVYKTKEELIQKVLIHGGINSIVLIGFSIFTLVQIKILPKFDEDSIMVLVIKSLLILIMILGNYLGGQLILKYKIGVTP